VTLEPAELRITAQYIDGPFRHLENRWQFTAADDATDVDFHISYEFKSVVLGMLAGAVFDQAFRRYAEAFEARARKIYGDSGMASGRPSVTPA
jgi:coenzyme Q-binding protein COQ10